jgi:hypothetical protein
MGGQGGFGPGFQDARSKLYRAEYAAATLALLAYLIYRSLYLGGLDWASMVFWIFFPDLVAFIPIGLSSKRKEWPSWGSYLYNTSTRFSCGAWRSPCYGSSSELRIGPSLDGWDTLRQTGPWGTASAQPASGSKSGACLIRYTSVLKLGIMSSGLDKTRHEIREVDCARSFAHGVGALPSAHLADGVCLLNRSDA